MKIYKNVSLRYTITGVLLIFIIAALIRFLYFGRNVYFSFDQARDFYFAGEILRGDLRLIGPPSAASPNLFPGPLSLYLYAFLQLIFGKNPEIMSSFFRFYNAAGVVLVYMIAAKLFDKKVGYLTAILYAISYEQTQYSLLMSHQPLALLPVLSFYLGMWILLFAKKQSGLILALFGLGLAIQFHFVYLYLFPIMVLLLFIFRIDIPKLNLSYILISFLVFLSCVSSYIVSEFKFGFRTVTTLLTGTSNGLVHWNEALYAAERFMHDTFIANYKYTGLLLLAVILLFVLLIRDKKLKGKGIFLLLWFLGGILPYLITGTKSYYYSAGATASLVILFSYFVSRLFNKYALISVSVFVFVLINNFLQIRMQNPKGPNLEIVIQPGMLLASEKDALDYIYKSAGSNTFALRALTVPLQINTTWSYLFEWYGKEKYGYLPVWSEKPAVGFPGNLPYTADRSGLSQLQFIIIEPLNGIRDQDKAKFFQEESYFTKVVEVKEFGTIVVQKREKI